MTKRTTDDWEALLNGTSKAPWKLHGIATFPNSPSGMWAPDLIPAAPGDGPTPNDGELAAAAPEAVAEVVRLRRALEGWRGNLEHHLKWTLRSDVREIEHLESKIESITRILEGHNDE